ncbi:hypothetical protein [Nitrosomonas sp.]|uniref:hypothetical protein n=1 Tax=Nitrosomonas sp. TaxID=42353 RepID=UPI0025D3B0AE|nr:hypothetical protein [Nitrosomonas sp.]MBY0485383.1 hypothetical protein [Nitrosomonas sp.]
MFEFTPVGSFGLTIAGLFRLGAAGVVFCFELDCDFCAESVFSVVFDGNEVCATAGVLKTKTALTIRGSDILLNGVMILILYAL